MPTYIREDQADIRVTVNGKTYGDSWSTLEGGNLEAEDSKTRPGGMGQEVSLGGPASRSDITATTHFTDVTATWVKELEAQVGVGTAKVAWTPLKPDRSVHAMSFTVQGILKAVTLPDMDGGGSDAAMLEIVVSCDETAA